MLIPTNMFSHIDENVTSDALKMMIAGARFIFWINKPINQIIE
jgi:hypothetical protein